LNTDTFLLTQLQFCEVPFQPFFLDNLEHKLIYLPNSTSKYVYFVISRRFITYRSYIFNILLTVHHSNVINTTNLIHILLSLSLLHNFIRVTASPCFKHHLPIFRRPYTMADLDGVVCGFRCELFSFTSTTAYNTIQI
jgi:hypothetical protein